MPSNLIQSYSKKLHKSIKELETVWNEARKEAEDMGEGKNIAYIHSIFKNMLGITESEYIILKQELFQESQYFNWLEFDKNFESILSSGDFAELPESPVELVTVSPSGEIKTGEEKENIAEPEFIQEEFYKGAKIYSRVEGETKYIEIFKNPSNSELLTIPTSPDYRGLLVKQSGDVYMWESTVFHSEVIGKTLQVKEKDIIHLDIDGKFKVIYGSSFNGNKPKHITAELFQEIQNNDYIQKMFGNYKVDF